MVMAMSNQFGATRLVNQRHIGAQMRMLESSIPPPPRQTLVQQQSLCEIAGCYIRCASDEAHFNMMADRYGSND